MLKTKVVEELKNSISEQPKKIVLQVATKKGRQKRLSTQDFLKGYDTIYQSGPQVKYLNPGVRERELQLINKKPDLF
jgi:hypothetical protein